jgi:hypothetical protein
VIVAFSTSSPFASVALFNPDGTLIGSRFAESNQSASKVCIQLLEELLAEANLSIDGADCFAVDIGPGSFTGTRVGVVLAKVMAQEKGVKCLGATSFDLLGINKNVFVPSRRGEFITREPGNEPQRVKGNPGDNWIGYGVGIAEPTYPHAEGFKDLIGKLKPIEPEELLPYYFNEPNISTPNKPYRKLERVDG